MWFFMYTCYILIACSTGLFFLTGLQGYTHLTFLPLNHPSLAIFTVVIYMFTQTLVIFFFVGTGMSIKEYVQEHEGDKTLYQRALRLKRNIYPPILSNIFLVGLTFIMGGAVHTAMIPAWSHGLLFCATVLHCIKTIRFQHRAFRENTFLVLEMVGVQPNRAYSAGG